MPVENTAVHPSASPVHTNAHSLSSFWLRCCHYLRQRKSLNTDHQFSQTAEVKSAREEYGCYASPLTWQQEQSVLSGPMVFKYKLPQLLFRFVRIYQGVEFSEGLYNPEKDVDRGRLCLFIKIIVNHKVSQKVF